MPFPPRKRRGVAFAKTQADKRRDVQHALNYYETLSGREDAPHIDTGAKAKRTRASDTARATGASTGAPEGTEADVSKAIGQLLANHPKVSIAIRINSGMAYSENGAPVWFYRVYKGPKVVVDWIALLKNGTMCALETKRPSWKGVSQAQNKLGERERAQEQFIQAVIAEGGVGGFVRSVEEALAVIDPKKPYSPSLDFF